MRAINVQIVNAFTDAGEGGNSAGVALNAERLTQKMKQKIAAKVGVSETAFVSASKVADFKLEFFTPARQIAHCGHATIATFAYLAQKKLAKGPRSSKETIDGVREIFINGEVAFMEQLAPKYIYFEAPAMQKTLTSLGIDEAALLAGHQPMIVNTGNSFMVVPLKNEETLKTLQPKFKSIEQVSKQLDLIGYYAFTLQTQVAGRAAAARMFAPRYGIQEEPATGTAAGPLACYLYDQLNIKKSQMIIEQGRLSPMPSPSELIVELHLEDGRITRLFVGGRAKTLRSLEIEI
jgi:PhzF family phenazine biosynthesis protein